jgi:exosortase/archaeosortase
VKSVAREGSTTSENSTRKAAWREKGPKPHPSIFGWKFFGGLALIAPMLLMSLQQSLKTTLITSSVGIILFFALALSLAARNLRGMDVLAATAAYAAVLVVFCWC